MIDASSFYFIFNGSKSKKRQIFVTNLEADG
jgi:hypothetical protein